MTEIKIVAFDLDGTILNDKGEISNYTDSIIEALFRKGFEVVPSTGRIPSNIPSEMKNWNNLRYIVSMNGAEVADIRNNKVIYESLIPNRTGADIAEFLKDKDVYFDAFYNFNRVLSENVYRRMEYYVKRDFVRDMIRKNAVTVHDLGSCLRTCEFGIQKMQVYTPDDEKYCTIWNELKEKFPDCEIATSISQNIEINAKGATKGIALKALVERLGYTMENVISFGDSLNDLSMIKMSGVGVCMANGQQVLKSAADCICLSNKEDGVARYIEEHLL